jgi:hypothetical protein
MLKGELRHAEPSLLILSRYNQLLPDQSILKSLAHIWPGEIKTPLTIHTSKGLEADYVIVNGLTADKYGFPSEIEDDPLLDLVLKTRPLSQCRRAAIVLRCLDPRSASGPLDRRPNTPIIVRARTAEWQLLRNQHRRRTDGRKVCPECRSGLIEEKGAGLRRCCALGGKIRSMIYRIDDVAFTQR